MKNFQQRLSYYNFNIVNTKERERDVITVRQNSQQHFGTWLYGALNQNKQLIEQADNLRKNTA